MVRIHNQLENVMITEEKKIVAKVFNATCLSELCYALNNAHELLGRDYTKYIDVTSLPTFGEEIEDAEGVWSWELNEDGTYDVLMYDNGEYYIECCYC